MGNLCGTSADTSVTLQADAELDAVLEQHVKQATHDNPDSARALTAMAHSMARSKAPNLWAAQVAQAGELLRAPGVEQLRPFSYAGCFVLALVTSVYDGDTLSAVFSHRAALASRVALSPPARRSTSASASSSSSGSSSSATSRTNHHAEQKHAHRRRSQTKSQAQPDQSSVETATLTIEDGAATDVLSADKLQLDVHDTDQVRLLLQTQTQALEAVHNAYARTAADAEGADDRALFHVRLFGFDAPELKPLKSAPHRALEMQAAKVAREFVQRAVGGQLVLLELFAREKYGRELATVWRLDQQGRVRTPSLNDEMVQRGLGKAYHGKTKSPWTRAELQRIVATPPDATETSIV